MPEWPLGLSSFVWTAPFTMNDVARFRDFAAMGYRLIEICVEDPATLDAETIRDAATDAELDLSISAVLGPHRSLSSLDPVVRWDADGYVRACLQFCEAVGGRFVSGPMYGVPGGAPAVDDDERRVRRDLAAEALQPLSSFAGELGLSIGIEPLNRFETDIINTVEQALSLHAAVGSKNLGLVLDTFHMNIEEKNLPAAIRAAGSHIVSFQASESDRGTIGTGNVDWAATFAALDETGYSGPVIVESFRHDIADIAKAVSIWRPTAVSAEALARDSASFLKQFSVR